METVKNDKGFRVIKMSLMELNVYLGGIGICDFCNGTGLEGYYVAVLNEWLCPECYEDWLKKATRYEEDVLIEEKRYQRVLEIEQKYKAQKA